MLVIRNFRGAKSVNNWPNGPYFVLGRYVAVDHRVVVDHCEEGDRLHRLDYVAEMNRFRI